MPKNVVGIVPVQIKYTVIAIKDAVEGPFFSQQKVRHQLIGGEIPAQIGASNQYIAAAEAVLEFFACAVRSIQDNDQVIARSLYGAGQSQGGSRNPLLMAEDRKYADVPSEQIQITVKANMFLRLSTEHPMQQVAQPVQAACGEFDKFAQAALRFHSSQPCSEG
jgi:hypothetical protein